MRVISALPVQSMSILPSWLNPDTLLSNLGAWAVIGVCLIIFAECGLLIGFFLPGDSLLFTAGLYIERGAIATPLWLMCVLVSVCAFVGNVCGYWIGAKAGQPLFNKPDSRLFKQSNVLRAHEFFERHGAAAIILARFVPIVRTFITAIAGVGRMDARKFFTYSAIGAVLWASGVTILGFFLGKIAFVHDHIELILVAIVLVSVIPIAIELLRARRQRRSTVG